MPSIGGQIGNKNNAKGKDWQDALRKAMIQYEDKDAGIKRGQALHKIATKVVQQALDGDPVAWQEIGNRLDGKPAQALQLSTDDDKPLFQAIKMVIVANNPNQINELSGEQGQVIEGELANPRIETPPVVVPEQATPIESLGYPPPNLPEQILELNPVSPNMPLDISDLK